MKARRIRKLRKRLGKIQTYYIRESASLFGDFFGCNRFCLIMDDKKITASSPQRAVQIYMKKYRKKYNRRNEYEREEYVETSEQWGNLMVTDESGFMRFYR